MKKTFCNKKLASAAIVGAIALTMIGSMAYFTDYATTQATGTAGTVAISLDSDINLLNEDGKNILNPGDMRDGSFSITNEGNKSIDVRTTIKLVAKDREGNAINLTGSATEQSEYDLYLREDVELVEGYGYQPKADAKPLEVKSIEGNTITYILPEYSLDGNKDDYAEYETVGDDYVAHSHDYDFVLVFKGEAGNEWQASSITIGVLVEAKQHENTQAGWEIVATEVLQGGTTVVAAENVITVQPDAPETPADPDEPVEGENACEDFIF